MLFLVLIKEFGVIDMKTKSYKTVETGFQSHSRYGWTAAGSMYCVAYSGTKFPQVIRVDAATEQVRWMGTCVKFVLKYTSSLGSIFFFNQVC